MSEYTYASLRHPMATRLTLRRTLLYQLSAQMCLLMLKYRPKRDQKSPHRVPKGPKGAKTAQNTAKNHTKTDRLALVVTSCCSGSRLSDLVVPAALAALSSAAVVRHGVGQRSKQADTSGARGGNKAGAAARHRGVF